MSAEEIHNSIPDTAPAAETATPASTSPESKVDAPVSVDNSRPRAKTPLVDEADVQLQEQGSIQEEVKPTSDEPAKTQEDSPVEIPDEQVDAAREAGFSDEQIIEFAESNPKILENLAAKFKVQKDEPKVEEPAPPQQVYSAPDMAILQAVDAVKLDPEKYEPELIAAVDTLKQATTALFNENVQHRQMRDKELYNVQKQTFDSLVDAISSELPQVGKSEKLDKSSTAVRDEIWNMARAIQTGNTQLSDKQAFSEAISWFKGKHGGKAVEKAVVDKLKTRSTKLMYRPKNRNITQKAPVSEEQSALDAIKEVKDKYKA